MSEVDIFGAEDVSAIAPAKPGKRAARKHKNEADVKIDKDTPAKEARYLIEIDEVEGMSNAEYVGINGEVFQIKRGEPVAVPERVLHVLQNAVAERVVQTHNPQGGVTTKRQKYSAVPYRILKVLND